MFDVFLNAQYDSQVKDALQTYISLQQMAEKNHIGHRFLKVIRYAAIRSLAGG